jgi:hypothetical protein
VSARQCQACGFLWAEREGTGSRLPEQREGELVDIRNRTPKEKNEVVLAIARGAGSLKQAIQIASRYGMDHKKAWHIWTHVLKKAAS